MENRTTLRWGAQEVGRLTAAPEGADTCFRAEYRLTEGLWRLYAVGRQNRLLLGCAEGGQGILQRRFSRQLTEGLGALLGDDVIAAKDERASSLLLPISQVESCSTQPRKSFEPEALSDLADSIRIHGIIQPLTVRKLQFQRRNITRILRRIC